MPHLWEAVALAVTVSAGSIAWLYQKAAERQERRIARYEKIVELANALLRVGRNPDHLDQMMTEIRKLWLFAPRGIVAASTQFREATDTGTSSEEVERAFFALVCAMRSDCSLGSALWPRVAERGLEPRDVKLMVARRD